MPIIQHPEFNGPDAPDTPIWRYLSLPKFLALLQTRSLYFSSLEFLAHADPFEGTLPPSRFAHRAWECPEDAPEEIRTRLSGYLHRGETGELNALRRFKDAQELRIRQAYAYRRSYFINCWHINSHESAAMWSLYSRTNEGIALVSSPARIEAALAATSEEVFAGCVRYGNYGDPKFTIDDGNAFRPILYKRQSFSHEAEYRLVHWDTNVTHKQIQPVNGIYHFDEHAILAPPGAGAATVGRSESEIESIAPAPGKVLDCDLTQLVERIVISPLAERWFAEVVEQSCSAWDLKVTVKRSTLADDPLK